MAMIMYLGHVAITVKDMDRAIDFYTKKLGFSVIRKGENPTTNVAIIGNGLTQLELLALKKENAKEMPPLKYDEIGIKHIAFHVDDLEGAIEGLKKRGVEFTSEIKKMGKISHIFFRDPDGTQLQLIQG
ncbi:VOC family protein [Candidatus Bathyarchaeota archaeon]|nr:VOC family protein [Candidatus Bathyarchaeota archaeon]